MSDDPLARRPPYDARIAHGDRVFRVRYRVDPATKREWQAVKERLEEAERKGEHMDRETWQRVYSRAVFQMVEAWDRASADGTPIPVTETALYALPADLLLAIMNGVAAHVECRERARERAREEQQ
jgi:hypothetical protein